MPIKSFNIDHTNLKPGCYLHDVKKTPSGPITTFDMRFKKPNNGFYLSNGEMHSLEHLIATYYTKEIPEKIYFGPMGCQTGFYFVVAGNKNIEWFLNTLPGLDKFINKAKSIPGADSKSCGNYRTLSLTLAKTCWNNWYCLRDRWGNKYPKIKKPTKKVK